jgi:hypothetical protein
MTTWTIHHLDRQPGELYRLQATYGPIVVHLKANRGNKAGTEAWEGRIVHRDRPKLKKRTEWLNPGAVAVVAVLLRKLDFDLHRQRAEAPRADIASAIAALNQDQWDQTVYRGRRAA